MTPSRKNHPDTDFVTQETCEERHVSGRWVQRFLVGLITVFVVAAVYAVDVAHEAQSTSYKTQVTLQSHLAAEAETSRYLKERLDEIRTELREQRKLLDSLLREGRGGMGK